MDERVTELQSAMALMEEKMLAMAKLVKMNQQFSEGVEKRLTGLEGSSVFLGKLSAHESATGATAAPSSSGSSAVDIRILDAKFRTWAVALEDKLNQKARSHPRGSLGALGTAPRAATPVRPRSWPTWRIASTIGSR